jgi:hypothetical protein
MMAAREVSRAHIIDVLRREGLPEVIDEVLRSLPEHVEYRRAEQFLARYGITKDMLISRMGGSP